MNGWWTKRRWNLLQCGWCIFGVTSFMIRVVGVWAAIQIWVNRFLSHFLFVACHVTTNNKIDLASIGSFGTVDQQFLDLWHCHATQTSSHNIDNFVADFNGSITAGVTRNEKMLPNCVTQIQFVRMASALTDWPLLRVECLPHNSHCLCWLMHHSGLLSHRNPSIDWDNLLRCTNVWIWIRIPGLECDQLRVASFGAMRRNEAHSLRRRSTIDPIRSPIFRSRYLHHQPDDHLWLLQLPAYISEYLVPASHPWSPLWSHSATIYWSSSKSGGNLPFPANDRSSNFYDFSIFWRSHLH